MLWSTKTKVPWTWGSPLSLQVRLRHRDHHIFDISEAGLSEGQQHKAKHQATSKAQSSLDHAIVLHVWCTWQLSTWHLAWCLRCRGSSGALSHEDQMHGRHAQAAGQEQRGVAGHFSKTRGKPHSLRCLEKSRSWKIALQASLLHNCVRVSYLLMSKQPRDIWRHSGSKKQPYPALRPLAETQDPINKPDLSKLPTIARHHCLTVFFPSLLLHSRICRIFCLTFLGLRCWKGPEPLRLHNSPAKCPGYVCPGYNTMCNQTANKPESRHFLVVDLSATPLLRNGLIHVEDVRGHVVQVLTTKIDPAASTFFDSCFEQQPVTASYSCLLLRHTAILF